jgi:hypothetical protein
MNLDDVQSFSDAANSVYRRLDEFRPLIRKKHETFTYQAFDAAMSDLRALFQELRDQLHELPTVKAELNRVKEAAE